MDKVPCIKCLKYPVCISKETIVCADLMHWLTEFETDTQKFVNRLVGFEAYWNKDLSILTQNVAQIEFKDKRDHHSCIIRKN